MRMPDLLSGAVVQGGELVPAHVLKLVEDCIVPPHVYSKGGTAARHQEINVLVLSRIEAWQLGKHFVALRRALRLLPTVSYRQRFVYISHSSGGTPPAGKARPLHSEARFFVLQDSQTAAV